MTINLNLIREYNVPPKRCLLQGSVSEMKIEQEYSKFFNLANGSLTTVYNYDISAQYSKIFQNSNLTGNQEWVLNKLTEELIRIKKESQFNFVIYFEKSFDDEILISKFEKDNDNLSYISIDEEGDIMLSKIDFFHKEPTFYENSKFDAEELVYNLLT
ncbi:MAG: hypothetical protein A2W98_12350 [Bacteroidetes bacterium GWF2_33_38]|nr:MAG: hypothetical protein A2W98_12350 [Bacteroidetes bacterium GWF2_33_38]OFY88493.1 MAG: hypothetical protein A2236_09480 [Bacteroidetes bacterium RIFOXYA2_FULL_33_7]